MFKYASVQHILSPTWNNVYRKHIIYGHQKIKGRFCPLQLRISHYPLCIGSEYFPQSDYLLVFTFWESANKDEIRNNQQKSYFSHNEKLHTFASTLFALLHIVNLYILYITCIVF